MLIDNLDMLEKVIYQVKAMLKEPNQDNFETIKEKVLEKLIQSQNELNPVRGVAKKELLAGEPHHETEPECTPLRF